MSQYNFIYYEEFKENPIDIFKREKYMIFCDKVANTSDYGNPEMAKRFKLNPKGMEVIKFASDQDYTNTGLNPRTECRLQKYMHNMDSLVYELSYEMTVTSPNLSFANVFQIMTQNSENKSKPLVQIEIRDGFVCIRQQDYKGVGDLIRTTTTVQALPNKLLRFRILFKPNTNSGFLKIYYEDKIIHTVSGRTVWDVSSTWWNQYGLYGAKDILASSIISRFYVKIGDSGSIISYKNQSVPIPSPIVPTPSPVVPIPTPVVVPIVPTPSPIVPIPTPVVVPIVPTPSPIVPIPTPVVPTPSPVVLPTNPKIIEINMDDISKIIFILK